FDLLFAAPCQWLSVPPVARYSRLPSVLYLQEPQRFLYEAHPELPWLAERGYNGRHDDLSAVRHWLGSALRVYPLRVQARAELDNLRAFDLVLVNSCFGRENVLRTYGIDA